MNSERRKEIAALIHRVEELGDQIALLQEAVEAVRDDEQDYYDNMPVSLQGGERGQAAEEALSYLEDAISAIEDFDVDSITSSLESASS